MNNLRVHFIGAGGIGMSALARYFLAKKYVVSGSDLARSPITDALRSEGMRIFIGHHKKHLPRGAAFVIASQAVSRNNPELLEARRRGVRIYSYPEMIGKLTQEYATIAVAGAHGKSTTSSLAAVTLIAGGLDPTVIIGTNLKKFRGRNFRKGKSSYLVLEADEFGNAFSRYSPAVAIVTNIDREHLDIYHNLQNIKKAFLGFLKNTKAGGILILNRDDGNLFSLHAAIRRLARKKSLRVIWFSAREGTAQKIRRVLAIPGAHNVSNALAVYHLAKVLDIPEKITLRSFAAYRGSSRRMEYRGVFRGAKVFDDYAHHPTEIKATLRAFREKFPGKRIVCVFQPHQAKRLQALFKEFAESFADADETLIMPVYRVKGRDETRGRYNARALVQMIQKKEPQKLLFYLADPKNLRKAIGAMGSPLSSHKVIVMMGAGDIVRMTDSLIS